MRWCRPASRALSHLLRHDPVHHHSHPSSLFSRHSPFTPLTRAFDDPFFSSPFSAPLYTVYEVRDDETNEANANNTNSKAEQQQHQAKQEEVKTAEPQQTQRQHLQQQQHHDQQQAHEHRLARQGGGHKEGRWLDRHSNRRHRHHHHHHNHHHPLSLFSPFESLFGSPFMAQSAYRPLEITVDLYSTPTAYQINAAIPGVRKEDIKLTIDDGVLTFEAERRENRGRPIKTSQPAAPSDAAATSSTTATASATPADATSGAPQAEQKSAEVEARTDSNTGNNSAAEVKAQESQAQQQQHEAVQEEEDDVSVHHVESYYGSVQRSLALPEDVNVDGLTARYEDGVLRIELPRIEERKQEPKKISIL